MRYISPFHYLPKDIIQNNFIDINGIRLIRKRMLAEIELSETQSLSINNKELTKFEVITLFDNLSNAKLLNLHIEIFNDKRLLDFLENGIFTSKMNSFSNPKLSNEDAINFISPYYKEAAVEFVNDKLNNIKKYNNHAFGYFFKKTHLLTNEDLYELYEYTTKKLTTLCSRVVELERKVENKNIIFQKEIDHLKLFPIVGILNSLPEDFSKLREDMAGNLNALGCDLINSSYNRFARHVLLMGKYLKASDRIKGYLKYNLAIARSNNNDFPKGYSFKHKLISRATSELGIFVSVFIIAFLLIIIAFFLFSEKIESNFHIDKVNFDTPTANRYAHYPIYGMENANFNTLMFFLYSQDTLPLNTKEVKFEKGDDVFHSLFTDFAFSLQNFKSVTDTVSAKKEVLVINESEYDCILIIRNAKIQHGEKLIAKDFSSIYIPSSDSLNIILQGDFNDIRPYLGKYIVENTLPDKPDIDFHPKYLFKIVPKVNLLYGVGLKLDLIKDRDSKIIIQQDSATHYLDLDVDALM